jgi:hypothetical protein
MTNFTQTSDLLYDRHKYKLYLKDGNPIIFDNWEDAKLYWFQKSSLDNLNYFEVLDKKQKSKSKGF